MRCPRCDDGILVVDALAAERYCQRCGAVVEEKLIDAKDGLFEFDRENPGRMKPTRSITSWMYPYKGLGMGQRYEDSPVEDSYENAFPTFEILWGSLRLPMHVRIYSALLWRRCYRRHLTRGRAIEPLSAALTHIASTDMSVKRGIGMAADAVDARVGTAEHYFALVTESLGLQNTPFRVRAIELIEEAIRDMGLDIGLEGPAIMRLDEMIGRAAVGRRKPRVMAAVAVYLAAKDNKTRIRQEALSKALGVSGRGIRRALRLAI